MPVLQTLFKDLFTQVHGSIEGMNEELREAYEKAGELERIQNKDHWDPFSAVLRFVGIFVLICSCNIPKKGVI